MKRYCNQCKNKDNEGIYQVSDYFWICENCNRARKEQYRNWQTLRDWNNKPTVDNLDEAVNYFNFLQSDREFHSIHKIKTISGDRGPICHVVLIVWKGLDPLGSPWSRNFVYHVCYNREYLAGYAAARFFERPGKNNFSVNWQSVHSKIVDDAMATLEDGVRIVIVMKSKAVHYIAPRKIWEWARDWECEHILPRESEPTDSIPVTKTEDYDPFYVPRLQESNKTV
jgi:hypothetical protein